MKGLEVAIACGALEDLGAIPANFGGNVNASIAISLKRIADMMEEDRKPRLELMPEGYIGEQEHRRFMRDSFLRDLNAWEAIAEALTHIASGMTLPASAIPSRRADDAAGGSAGTEGSAVPQADAQTEGE
jgi:hypothetical protein